MKLKKESRYMEVEVEAGLEVGWIVQTLVSQLWDDNGGWKEEGGSNLKVTLFG
jgi:hypothetical protein